MPDEELVGQQYLIVMTHSGGFGPLLPTEVTRAAMAVRLVGLTRGGSGASPAVADSLVALLNGGVHPLLPRTSSVGAGDLGAMALVAQVAIGAGRAEYRGEVLDGGEALARAGIPPLALQAKDGLAMISANGVSVGQGALVVERAGALADAAERGGGPVDGGDARQSVGGAAGGRRRQAVPRPGGVVPAAAARAARAAT